MKNKNIKVALVEDDKKIREGLEYILNHNEGFECAGSFESGEDALQNLKLENIDIVLMDIYLPGISGIECVEKMKSKRNDINIMMLTVYDTNDNIFNSLSAGANGYVLKNTPTREILKSIKELHEGGSPMSNEIARKVIKAFQVEPQEEISKLTPREYEILQHLAMGITYQEIGEKLFISVETVRFHIKNIYQKLHVHSRTEAVLKLFHHKSDKPFGKPK